LEDTIQVDDPEKEGPNESWFTLAVRRVAGTPLVLVNRSHWKLIAGKPVQYEEAAHFALMDYTGKTVWEIERPNDYTGDTHYVVRRSSGGSILQTDVPGRFELWFVTDNERVTYAVEGDAESGWRVRELERSAMPAAASQPAAPGPPDTLDSLTPRHLSTLELQLEVIPRPEIRDIRCFDIDDRSRIGFVRRDRECMPLAAFRGDTPRLCYRSDGSALVLLRRRTLHVNMNAIDLPRLGRRYAEQHVPVCEFFAHRRNLAQLGKDKPADRLVVAVLR